MNEKEEYQTIEGDSSLYQGDIIYIYCIRSSIWDRRDR